MAQPESRLVAQLRASVANTPDKTLLGFTDSSVSYREFLDLVELYAAGLARLGVGAGQNVGVLGLNSVDTMASLFAASAVGAVPVPINSRFKPYELGFVFNHAELTTLITSDRQSDPTNYARLAAQVTDVPLLRHRIQLGDVDQDRFIGRASFLDGLNTLTAEVPHTSEHSIEASDAPAMLMYTSGTTGNPRGCILTHAGLLSSADNLRQRLEVTDADVIWDIMPFFHMGAIQPFLAAACANATMVSMRHFEPRAALTQLRDAGVTIALPAFETIWMGVLTQPDFAEFDLSGIRVVQNVGVENRLRYMQAQMPHAVQVSNYGMTEMGGYGTMHRLADDEDTRMTTGGMPLGDMEFRIVDIDNEQVPSGELGEIVSRGTQMFAGYYKDESPKDSLDSDGWFHSGDLGRMDADGSVTFVTRRKDMLKVGGENVAAAEIETFLATHPGILIAVVVAAEDERYGQVPAAFVEPRSGVTLTEGEVIDFCRGKIATYKVPRYVRFVNEWPMSGTKIQKFRLRTAINDELDAAGITVAEKITTL